MSTLLTIFGFVLLAILVVLAIFAALAGLGVVFAGAIFERIFEILIPGRKTGLGPAGLIGETAEVVRAFAPPRAGANPEGMIRLSGELWKARMSDFGAPVEADLVRVVEIEGLVAIVADPRELPEPDSVP